MTGFESSGKSAPVSFSNGVAPTWGLNSGQGGWFFPIYRENWEKLRSVQDRNKSPGRKCWSKNRRNIESRECLKRIDVPWVRCKPRRFATGSGFSLLLLHFVACLSLSLFLSRAQKRQAAARTVVDARCSNPTWNLLTARLRAPTASGHRIDFHRIFTPLIIIKRFRIYKPQLVFKTKKKIVNMYRAPFVIARA